MNFMDHDDGMVEAAEEPPSSTTNQNKRRSPSCFLCHCENGMLIQDKLCIIETKVRPIVSYSSATFPFNLVTFQALGTTTDERKVFIDKGCHQTLLLVARS
jgi:hypothetical protein